MMYNQYLKVKPSKKNKFGVFTSVEIPAKSPICEFRGDLFKSDNLNHDLSEVLQIGVDSYLGPSGEMDDYINHSCNPNCSLFIIGKRAFLYSLYVIPANSEITFDYSTSSTDDKDNWIMQCNCGSHNCRKSISGYQYLPDNLKQQYKADGMIPLFLSDSRFSKK